MLFYLNNVLPVAKDGIYKLTHDASLKNARLIDF